MHPLIARLHPGYRTAALVWVLSRLLFWGIAARDTHIVEAMEAILRASATPPVVGLMLASWDFILNQTGATIYGITIVPVLIAELLFFAALTSVYLFTRQNNLPHVAERATWLWAFCPLMVLTVTDLSWSLSISLGAIALSAAARGRHEVALVSAILATGARLEFVLLAPAIAALGWTSFHSGRHRPWARWLTGIGPIAAFAGWVLFALTMAGRANISLRTLHLDGSWRKSFALSLEAHATELATLALALLIIALTLRSWRRFPKFWLLAIVPLIVWPFLHEPPTAAVAVILWALPCFVHGAEATENPTVERPVLIASVLGCILSLLWWPL